MNLRSRFGSLYPRHRAAIGPTLLIAGCGRSRMGEIICSMIHILNHLSAYVKKKTTCVPLLFILDNLERKMIGCQA